MLLVGRTVISVTEMYATQKPKSCSKFSTYITPFDYRILGDYQLATYTSEEDIRGLIRCQKVHWSTDLLHVLQS